jgi:hypothetical protein
MSSSLDDAPEDPKVKFLAEHGSDVVRLLVGGQGVEHSLTIQQLSLSGVVMTALMSDPECRELALPLVDADIMDLIAPFLRRHNGVAVAVPKPIRKSATLTEIFQDPLDAALAKNHGCDYTLAAPFRLMLAANYLQIDTLLALCSTAIAVAVTEAKIDLETLQAALVTRLVPLVSPEEEEKEEKTPPPKKKRARQSTPKAPKKKRVKKHTS